jgi:hypothetical protein
MSSDTPKVRAKPKYLRRYETVNLKAPAEFSALCAAEQISPAELVRQFIADLCDIRPWVARSAYVSNGQAAVQAARAYHAIARQARAAKASAQGGGEWDES